MLGGDNKISYAAGKTISGDYNKDGVKEWYYYRVDDIKTYVDDKISGTYTEISSTSDIIGKKGIIVFGNCNWEDATGHIDVWDGTKVLGSDDSSQCSGIYFLEIK